jgi:predicted SnoaL-like aldol condensation-catalyzing enzyme
MDKNNLAEYIASVLNHPIADVYVESAWANGDLIHLRTHQDGHEQMEDWVLTLEWDGLVTPATSAPDEAP